MRVILKLLTALAVLICSTYSLSAPLIGYKIVDVYPHDEKAFTQGLVIHDGELYEGTGLYGSSSLRRVELETGAILKLHTVPEHYFGEGITVFGGMIYQLTYRARRALVYDKQSFALVQKFRYDSEGWGLTHNDKELIMSDGSEWLYFIEPDTFTIKHRIEVTDNDQSIRRLNELEYINGLIYANVWRADRVAIIDPASGVVLGWLDFSGLLESQGPIKQSVDVLNGIAYDPGTDRLYITGKLWPWMFAVKVELPLLK